MRTFGLMILSLTATVGLIGLDKSAEAGGGRGGDQTVGPDTQNTFELVGFSDDGRQVGLRVADEQGRLMFQVLDVRKGKIKDTVSFLEGQDKKGLRRLKKKGITAEPLGPENEKGVTLMSAQKGNKLVIFAMKGENCTKAVAEIPLTKVKKSKRNEQPEAFAKTLTWGPRGKYVAVVYHEKYKDGFAWSGDRFHGFKFKAYKANCYPPESK